MYVASDGRAASSVQEIGMHQATSVDEKTVKAERKKERKRKGG